jgi:zinc/manganese transport system substrate-binding protein
MSVRYSFAIGCLVLGSVFSAQAADEVTVVASFSILGDLVKNVGGDRVAVTSLVGADNDAHVFTPSPQDAQKVKDAQVLVMNGLGFEGWMERLVSSTGFKGKQVVATKGIRPIEQESGGHDHHGHAHGVQDPHAWHDVNNVRLYVAAIRDGLIAADPAGKEDYQSNADTYLNQLTELNGHVRAMVQKLPQNRRTVVTSHDAFAYFGKAYGLTFKSAQGMSNESEPSAKGIAALVTQIKAEKVPVVFVENISNPKMLEQIARESGAKMGGKLYSDALSAADGPAPSYIQMVQYNISTLYEGLKP